MSTFPYTVIAVTPSQMRATRHGISRTQGGQEIARFDAQYPDTPIYMAIEQMKDQCPNCTVEITGIPA